MNERASESMGSAPPLSVRVGGFRHHRAGEVMVK
jgi:hypothetical protein